MIIFRCVQASLYEGVSDGPWSVSLSILRYFESRILSRNGIEIIESLLHPKYETIEKQGHRHKSRALIRENVKTCENL